MKLSKIPDHDKKFVNTNKIDNKITIPSLIFSIIDAHPPSNN